MAPGDPHSRALIAANQQHPASNRVAIIAAVSSAKPPTAVPVSSLLEATVPGDYAGLRADAALARLFPQHSRHRIQLWGREGRVTLDGRPADLAKKVWGGERACIAAAELPEQTSFRPEAIALDVVFEDDAMIVINKPAGLVVHPASGHWQGTLLNALLHHAPDLAAVPRAGIVHRLDKDTSGLLVVAKTLVAQTDLVRQLQQRTVKRVYWALVHGQLAREVTIEAPIGRDPQARTRMAVVSSGKPARTHVRMLKRYAGGFSLVECALDTGRTHQIRVHLRSIGHPLVGDPTYGARRSELPPGLQSLTRQALHARQLALKHPSSGESLGWEAPLPDELQAALDSLR